MTIKDDYKVQVHGRLLREGYTTGTCATAAVYAAALLLKTGQYASVVQVDTPKGRQLTIEVERLALTDQGVLASVIKDGGDDQDATHGLEIGVYLSLKETPSSGTGALIFKAGEGVGVVTKGGLSVEIGEPAINPTPREMMRSHFYKVFDASVSAYVEVFAVGGKEAAKKTLNEKLGVLGGISIIGTTGVVSPMSEDAFKKALALELKQTLTHYDALSNTFAFVFGNYGEAFAIKNGIPPELIIKTSNFIGFMLDEAKLLGIRHLVIVGNIGKLIKVAGGIFHTHSRVADGRFEILGALLALERAPYEFIELCMGLNTVEEAVGILLNSSYQSVFKRIAKCVVLKATEHVKGEIVIDCVLFSEKSILLYSTLEDSRDIRSLP
jgi:cobalt-precorrin-5B (C1)-methyltransferase